MKKTFLAILAVTFAITAIAQNAAPNMLNIMKNDEVIFNIPLADFDGITFVFEDPATTDPGVVINGIKWATRNVDMPGTFATNPEDAGMFYQWNRNIGWSSTGYEWPNPMPNWNTTNPSGTTWYSANCPCPPGWRVPTIEELESLINSVSTWVTNWNDTGVNGRVFGTYPNQIFLPAVGWRFSSNGALSPAGTNGNYWSSTFRDVNTARTLWFDSGIVYAGITTNIRTLGLSVRCVAE